LNRISIAARAGTVAVPPRVTLRDTVRVTLTVRSTAVPKKSLGQHFLTDPGILERIVEFSRVGPGDTVVEIGPGRGTLTRVLARRAAQVYAIEVDGDLIGPLEDVLPANVTLIAADALDVDYTNICPAPYHIVANLPYNISTPLIERFVAARSLIGSVTVLVQREVADRILAAPGTREYSPLTIGVQYFAEVERGFVLKPGSFSPPPKVDSRVIRMEWRSGAGDDPGFLEFIRGVFAARRKTLANNLNSMFPLHDRRTIVRAIAEIGHPAAVRAERIPIPDLERLHRSLIGGRTP
jgi:16S rRNA (adenine1518-N6/adenine1519-N6)-dimethyltransferase